MFPRHLKPYPNLYLTVPIDIFIAFAISSSLNKRILDKITTRIISSSISLKKSHHGSKSIEGTKLPLLDGTLRFCLFFEKLCFWYFFRTCKQETISEQITS